MIRSVAVRVSSLRVRLLVLALASLMLPIAAEAQATASFGPVIATVGGGFSSPHGVAVDVGGNIYVADYSNNAVYEMPANCASSSCVKTLGGGFYYPDDVAVDGSGNVYVADYSNSAVKKMSAGCASSSCVTTLGGGFSHPSSVAVDGSGNVYVADYGNSAVYEMPAGCASSSCVTKLGGPYNNFLNPTGVAVDGSGNVYVADAGNNAVKEMSPGCSNPYCVTRLGGYTAISSPTSVAVDSDGNVYVTDAYIYAETVYKLSANCNGTSCVSKLADGFNNPTGVAVDGSGNVYVADYRNHAVKEIMTRTVNFLTVPVGTASAAATLPITFTSAGKLSSSLPYFVVTEGAANLDFKAAATQGANACNGTTAYAAGDVCTINVTFTPTKAGPHHGAFEIRNANESPIVQVNLYGTGSGPQAVFSPSTQSTLGRGFSYPAGTAVDRSGAVYIADYGNNAVKVMPAGCSSTGCVATLGGGFKTPFGVAVDGWGNVYVADYGNNAVKEMPAACSSSSCVTTLGGGFSKPGGVTVDGSGNVYVTDNGNNAVKKMRSGCTSSSCVTTLVGGFNGPFGVAVDGSGNVYVADNSNNAVKEIPAGCTSPSCVTTLGGSFNGPYGVAVDSSGSVYVADLGRVQVMPAGCTSSSCLTTLGSSFSAPYGVALDSSGNIYVADISSSAVNVINRAAPPSLSFASTAVGSTSSDSPQTAQVSNIGNQPLLFSPPGSGTNPSYPANFPVDTSDGNLCSSAAPLAEGSSCDVSVNFAPTSVGANTGSVVLTDNTLNQTSATQSISLNGTGLVATQTITFPAITGTHEALTSFTLSATADSGLTVAFASASTSVCTVSGTTVSLLIPGTCVIQATQPGNSSYLAATMVSQSFTVSSLTQTITFPAILGTHNALTSFTLSATADSGLTVAFASTSTSVCTVSGTAVSLLISGTCVIQATQAGNSTYAAATMVSQSFAVSSLTQTITFPAITGTHGALTSFTLSATADSGLTVVFASASSNVCAVSGITVSLLTPGTCTIQATQPGNSVYAAAAIVSQSFTVGNVMQIITFPAITATHGALTSFTLSATSDSGLTVVFASASTSICTVSGTTVSLLTPGICTIQATQPGNSIYPAAAMVTQSITVSDPPQTVPVTITNAGTLGAIYVLTKGQPNLDFQVETGGTCVTGASYTANDTCTVAYTFLSKAPGQRLGAVQLVDSTGTIVLGTTLLTGIGTGPALVFPDNTTTSTLGSGFSNPEGVAVDGAGNVYLADHYNSSVKKIVAVGGVTSATSTVITLGSGFNQPTGVAVDGAGNVFVADDYNDAVKEIVAVGGVTSAASIVNTLGSGFYHPSGVAVDGAGNVYVADRYNDAVKEIVAVGGVTSSASTVITLGSGFYYPSGVAVDGTGNVYVADLGNNAAKKIVAVGGVTSAASTVITLGSGLERPYGVAVDAAGNVYVADFGNNAVKEIVAVGGVTSSASTVITLGSGFHYPTGVTVDGTGNVYVADFGNNAVKEIPLATPPSLSFTTTNVGSTSADSPQTLLLQNIGNVPLLFPAPGTGTNPSISTNFLLGSGSTCPQLTSTDTTAGTLAPGTCTDLISFLPTMVGSINGALVLTDNQPNAVASITLSGNATQGTPTITFAVPNHIFGDGPFTVSAASNSATAFTYAVVSGPATISGSTVTLTGVGTVILSANQAANGNYTAATVTTSFTVAAAVPALNFAAIAAQTYGNAPFAVSATSASSGAVTYTVVSGPATIFGSTVTLTGAGTVTISASQTANGNYAAATATTTFSVAAAVPALNFVTVVAQTYGNASFTVSATSASTGTITYTVVSGPATVSGSTVTLTGAGTVTILASQAANGNYAAATATTSFTVAAAVPVLNFTAIANQTYGAAPFTVSAASASSGTITYSVTRGPATVSGNTVTVTGVGTVVLSASQSANGNYAAAAATTSFTVNPNTPTLSWNAPSPITYGTALSATQLDAHANVAGTFSYTPAFGAVLTAGKQTLSVTFTPTDTVDYNTATITLQLTVNQSSPVITWATPAAISYGTALGATQLNASSTTPGTISYSPAAGTVLQAGPQTLTATFTPTDTADYATTTATVVLTVSQAASTITWATPASIPYGVAIGRTQLNASATIAGTFVYSPAAGTMLQAGAHTLMTNFTPVDTANYTGAAASVTLTVNKVTPAIGWSTPATIVYGSPLASVLSATATASSSPVAGSFSYTATPASGSAAAVSSSTVLAAGSYTLTAAFTPSDSTDYNPTTATLMLTVSLPTPVIGSLSPGYTTAASAAFTLTVNGSGFVPTSTASWGTTALSTQVLSSTQLTATVPATLIATAGQASIQVVNSSGSQTSSSNTEQFEIDSAGPTTTPPSFTTVTATVSAGSAASYPVTLPTTATAVTVTCLNLPVGATCSYSATTGVVTIATSSTTPSGTYQIVAIFNETLPGVAGSSLLFPLLLLPVALARRKWLARNFWVALCAAVLMAGAASTVGCGGSSSPAPSHQATSSSSVTLTIR